MSMRKRIASAFEAGPSYRADHLMALIISDYIAAYGMRGESSGKLAGMFVPRMLANPELHATALLRIALRGPRILLSFWRTVLIAKHSIDMQGGVEIGAGLRLPHPFGITLGRGLVIGRDVTIYQNVTIGARPPVDHLRRARREPSHVINPSGGRPCATIEDDVIILPGSMVLGPITVGRRAVVGAQSWLDHDLPPEEVHLGGRQA